MATLTKVSTFSGDLGETVRKYDPRFRETRSILGNTIQYGLYTFRDRPNLIMASKQIEERLSPAGYNFIVTITSDEERLNEELAENFRVKTGIELREAPSWLVANGSIIDMTFEIFKRHGERAMDILAQLGAQR